MQHTATHFNMLQHTAPHYDILQHSERPHLRRQHTATHCNTPQHIATHYDTLWHTATHCNTLWHPTTQRETPPEAATHCNTLQHTATHCNTMQHTAMHCNTLQHITTRCSTLRDTTTQRDALPLSVSIRKNLLFFSKSAKAKIHSKLSSALTSEEIYWLLGIMVVQSAKIAVFCGNPVPPPSSGGSHQIKSWLLTKSADFWGMVNSKRMCDCIPSSKENEKWSLKRKGILQHTAAHCNTLQHAATHVWWEKMK